MCRNAAGLATASCRYRVTASSIAARAPGRSPTSDRDVAWLFKAVARSGRNAAGLAAATITGFPDRDLFPFLTCPSGSNLNRVPLASL